MDQVITLREARQRLGWNQKGLAQATGLSPTTINTIEKGSQLPGINAAIKIANALGVDPLEVAELREGYSRDGIPGDGCSCGCGGVKVLPENPRSKKLSIQRTCAGCGEALIYQSRTFRHRRRCGRCVARVAATEGLRAKESEFAQDLLVALDHAGITLAEARARAGISAKTMYRYISGVRRPRADLLASLAEVLQSPQLLRQR